MGAEVVHVTVQQYAGSKIVALSPFAGPEKSSFPSLPNTVDSTLNYG
jgi:hypothetical protein